MLSANVAGRTGSQPLQQRALLARRPDVLALQEVTLRTLPDWRAGLAAAGYRLVDSFDLSRDHGLLTGPRRYGELIASRWPLKSRGELQDAPWPERVLRARVASPSGDLDVCNVHLPAGSVHGWTKVETFEAIFRAHALVSGTHRILCGDFSSPQLETAAGETVTWGQKIGADGNIRLNPARGERWDAAERNVLLGLQEWGLHDIYRHLQGLAPEASWYTTQNKVGRRFDHIFATLSLNPRACAYVHDFREQGLSDHSPIEAEFEPLNP